MKIRSFTVLITLFSLGLGGCVEVASESVVSDGSKATAEPFRSVDARDEANESVAISTKEVTPMVSKKTMPRYNELTAEEKRVIIHKGTERAYEGEYTDLKAEGTFICRQCNAPLYTSEAKFDSHCGWPSFDDQLGDAVKQLPDPDGYRVEIVCSNCEGHLGHVFTGERMTAKNTRHCVNSISVKFIPKGDELPKVIRAEDEATE